MRIRGISLVIVKIIYAIAVFVISLLIFSAICNEGNADMTNTLSNPSLPVVNFLYDGFEVNEMFGFDEVLDTSHIKNHITPLMPGRNLSLKINTYGETIYKIKYEVRNLEGDRLIESSDVTNYVTVDNNTITADITLKDLFSNDTYYSFCVLLEKSSGQTIRYYTNIIKSDNINPSVFIDFAKNFTSTSFDKERAITELVTYMETDGSSADSDFHYVDIHSSLNQLAWGKLDASIIDEPVVKICEIDKDMATIILDYYITINQDEKDIYYKVSDIYRLRQGNERIFLLDFKRNVDQIFSLNTATIKNNKIVLGISDMSVNMKESSDGNQIAFERNGRLYSYNINDNKMSFIFGFYEDGQEMDKRLSLNDHGIKIFSVDERGNVYFMVYGYMNRGNHEGKMGAVIYYYDNEINNVEEKVFINYDRSFDFLEKEINKLSFVNSGEQSFVFVKDSLYKIDLNDATSETIVQNVPFNGIVVSENNDKAAWIGGGDINNATQIAILNMVNGSTTYVQAGDDERVKVIGFFGDDLVYGVAKKDDITVDNGGNTIFPMYAIYIRDEGGQILKEYKQDNYYITDANMNEDMLSLNRVRKSDDGYVSVEDDQIMNNKDGYAMKNKIESVVTDNYEKIVQMVLKSDIQRDKMLIMTPRFVLYEGNRDMEISASVDYPVFYVYSEGSLILITDKINEAVEYAYEKSGVVVNESGNYIFTKGVYPEKNQIMAIKEESINPDEDTLMTKAVCLNKLLAHEGKNVDTRESFREGVSSYEILKANMADYQIVNITGCDVMTYMYYLAQDIPIFLEMRNGGSYLLIGYNQSEFVFFDPLQGTIYKDSIEDAASLIDGDCKEVLTYIRQQK